MQRNRQLWTLFWLLSAAFLAFGLRLTQLQVRDHSAYASRSVANAQRQEVIPGLRGEIYTRDGMLVAGNRTAVDLIYHGGEVSGLARVAYLAGIPARLPEVARGEEAELARNLPPDAIAGLSELTAAQPSLELRERPERTYPQGNMLGHLLGYTRETNAGEVAQGGRRGALVGASGVESVHDAALTGRDGVRLTEVTARGQRLGSRVLDPGARGQDVVLTVDSRLQRAAEDALQAALTQVNDSRARHGQPPETVVRGAIVALDPRSGEVLALASAPPVDPNWFAQSPRPPELVSALRGEGGKPLLNRAALGFDPGSVFKPTSTLAFIERWGDRTFRCTPSVVFGGARRRNWSGRDMGPMTARDAIAQSCNTWYYNSAITAGPIAYADALAERARDLGFGRAVLGLPGEQPGLLESPADYARDGRTWWPGNSLSLAIGQGPLLATPLQLARALAILISGEERELRVVNSVGNRHLPSAPPRRVAGQAADFAVIREGMALTVSAGTATHELGPGNFPVPTGGKTGTAQNAESVRRGNAHTHAWYEGYGPLDNPHLVVVTLIENGGEGSGPALRATKRVMAAHWCLDLDERGRLRDAEAPPCLPLSGLGGVVP